MKLSILVLMSALALPVAGFGQGDEGKQGQEQAKEPVSETHDAAPAKTNKLQHSDRAQTSPAAKVKNDATAQENRAEDANRKDAAAGAAGSESTRTNTTTHENKTTSKVNVQEFRERHKDVFSLGEHPKEFFVQKYGENHVRLIENMYFVYVDGCWVSVHVDGYGYSERVICSGDPDYIEVY